MRLALRTYSNAIGMSNSTPEIEIPDPLARAARATDPYHAATDDLVGERMVLNMGPSHPATHGVLRLVLELDGEIVHKAEPDVGFLHRGDEKIAENMHYNQFVPYTDRLDYLAPLANNVAYACAVEKLMGWTLPPRGQALRVLCCELARISSHMLGIGVCAMDVGAMTAFLYTMTEREKVHNLCEQLTGARFTTSYTRVGGQLRDMPPGFEPAVRQFLDECLVALGQISKLLDTNKIFLDRMVDVGIITRESAIAWGLTGPNLRGSGVARDLRKDNPYLGYENYQFDVPVADEGDCYARYQVRMEEIRQAVAVLPPGARHHARGPGQPDGPEEHAAGQGARADVDGGTHPPFHRRHPGHRRAGRRGLFRRGKPQGRTRVSTSIRRVAGFPTA